ncbi:MAG: response regulator transcription factor [Bacteroidetes bacterium]|nr:response regulator transcription factor [Bacteroidota bacterium]
MIRVFIADDHALIREGLKRLLQSEPDLELAGESVTADDLMGLVPTMNADVLLLDLSMPGRPVLEVIQDIRALRPLLRILILTAHPEDFVAIRMLRAGASGYVTKETASEELLKAIRKAAAGGRYVSSHLADRLAEALDETTDKLPHEMLSDREYQVLLLIAQGKTGPEIAGVLGISPATVNTYRARLMEKMGVSSTSELMSYAIGHGLTGSAPSS